MLAWGLVFGAEQGAELMWPTESPWMWWGIAGAIAALWIGFEWFRRRRKLGPEVRISNTTTYREQPDGSRIVTQTTLAERVRIAGRAETTMSSDPPTLTIDEPDAANAKGSKE